MNTAVTQLGKAVAQSGLRPESAFFLTHFAGSRADQIVGILPQNSSKNGLDDFVFLLCHTAASSPEFGNSNSTRFLPWAISPLVGQPIATKLKDLLCDSPWERNPIAANAAALCVAWINGAPIRELEKSFQSLTGGSLLELFRNLSWVITGWSNILDAASDPKTPENIRPSEYRRSEEFIGEFRRVIRLMQRIALRLTIGLPDAELWLAQLSDSNGNLLLRRDKILKLIEHNQSSLPALTDSDNDSLRAVALSDGNRPNTKLSNQVRDAARLWKTNQRQRRKELHLAKTHDCPNSALVERFYQDRESAFEKTFEDVLEHLNITCTRLDIQKTRSRPDYEIKIGNFPEIIVEIKSKQNENLVGVNAAIEVLSAAHIVGKPMALCLTVCQPGFDPSVPSTIANVSSLCVVEANDLAEALIRICKRTLSYEDLHRWLTKPGIAYSSELPPPLHWFKSA